MLDVLAFKATDVRAKNAIVNGDFSRYTGSNGVADEWTAGANITGKSVVGGVQTFIGAGALTSSASNHFKNSYNALTTAGHKYYVSVTAKATVLGTLRIGREFSNFHNQALTTNFVRYSLVHTHDGTNMDRTRLTFGATLGDEVSLKHALTIDLTDVFGAGNEPSTAEMDLLLAQFPNSFFNGVKNLYNAKYFMLMYLAKIRELELAIAGLGGS